MMRSPTRTAVVSLLTMMLGVDVVGSIATPISIAPQYSGSPSTFGGAFLTNTCPIFAPPFGGCPMCPDEGANGITGTCACPAGSVLVQNIATISDCALTSNGVLRPAVLGLCVPLSFQGGLATSSAGAFQVDTGGCRSPNLVTDACTCPLGFTALDISVGAPVGMPSDNKTSMQPSVLGLCLPTTPRPTDAGLVGAFQMLDPAPGVKTQCVQPNPTTQQCACATAPTGLQSVTQSFRVITYIGGTSAIVGSTLTLCGLVQGAAEPPSTVSICTGVTADNTGRTDASLSIQQCLNSIMAVASINAPQVLSIPPGTYLFAHRIEINVSYITLNTIGVATHSPGCGLVGAAPCATFRAAVELTDRYGLVYVHDVSNITLDHIALDGNRGARVETGPGLSCGGKWQGHEDEGRDPGYNAAMHNCQSCSLFGFASINAICGTALEFSGDNATFERCLFRGNGDHFGRNSESEAHKWSDGLTMNSGAGATVSNCVFADNSDINFIIANGHGAVVTSNTVHMVGGGSFGGMMLDNFNNPAASDFHGVQVYNNTIMCGNRCHYGIELGPRPWYTAGGNLRGPAQIVNNTISGAAFFINVDGAGVEGAPFTVFNNKMIGDCEANWPCVSNPSVRLPCSQLNISPQSFVNRNGETLPTPTHLNITDCP
eukprot:m.115780 g.115780  ORF g.115780 m.115780 type:complete len:658 (-) comp28447_c0_seq2:326-2299(-)